MTYSLVNMPVLGFDLCRLPDGPQVADVLLATLQLDDGGIAALAARHPGAAHLLRWRHVVRCGTPRPPLVTELRAIAGSGYGIAQARDLVQSLERGLIGNLEGLVHFVRHDVLSWTWHRSGAVQVQGPTAVRAMDVIAEALAAGYAREVLPGRLAALLAAPWAAAELCVGTPDLGPFAATVYAVLDRLAALDDAERTRLRSVSARAATPSRWPEAVHDASWAVYLTGRLRAAAAAQLLAVRAFSSGGLTARDAAYGVWNLVSGVVQSVVVGDLLDAEIAAILRGQWLQVFDAL